MRVHKRKMGILILFILLSCLLTSCYRSTVKEASEYDSFREDMKEQYERLYEFLPELGDKSCIEDMYLYYWSGDLFDSYHTIYLNCVYSEEEYEKEEKRLKELFADSSQINSDSFEYESLGGGGYTSWTHVFHKYVLFEKENLRIVYIDLFEDSLHGRSTKIPDEYLPKDLVEVRKTGSIPPDNWYEYEDAVENK
ncbi:MAG: hypothetical protein IJ036_00320 [Lachnospiraceae bacterium]|nr:hypothetical protein [Lachnospiraceae bacterium]